MTVASKSAVGSLLALAYLVALIVQSGCRPSAPIPPPSPGGTGGSAWVDYQAGGSAGASPLATGGTAPAPSAYDRCVTEQTADPVTRRVASESGTPVPTLVRRICSDPVIQRGYQ